jgi:outer membrane protein assembly factor BamB
MQLSEPGHRVNHKPIGDPRAVAPRGGRATEPGVDGPAWVTLASDMPVPAPLRAGPSLGPLLLAAGLLAQPSAPPPTPNLPAIPERPTLSASRGDYRSAWITLEGAGNSTRVFIAWRDGKPVQFWSLSPQLPGGVKPVGNPKLLVDAISGDATGQKLRADIDLRLVSVWAPIARTGLMRLSLDMLQSAEGLSGTWKISVNGASAAEGSAKGSLMDAAHAAKANGIAKGQDWPSFYGTLAANRGPDYGKPFIDDLSKAQPVWRSEVVSLSGWGTGVDSRYKKRAAFGTLCGGSSTPVLADGLLYLYHYWPSGDADPDGENASILESLDHPVEKEHFRRFFSKRADLIVTAIDAATGRTVWESRWPGKQGNYQTHKWRGENFTPAVAKEVLVVGDYSQGLHAFDAKTGAFKWTRGGGGPVQGNNGAIGPVISGNIVVWSTRSGTVGLELVSGKELWKGTGGGARRMVIDGKERVLLTGANLTLVDPADGRVIASGAFPGSMENKGKIDVGRGPGANLVCEGPYIVSFETSKPADKPVGHVIALKVEGDQIRPAWKSDATGVMEDGHIGLCIANGHVYTAFQDTGAYCIELATGRTVKNLPELTGHSNPTYVAVDDRIFFQPECQHGRQAIHLLDARPGSFGPLGANWRPPHNDTTAYGEMPINNVVADGRIFIRGMDGVYCYDLRAGK